MRVEINGENLTVEMVHAVARDGAEAAVSAEAMEKVNKCRSTVEELVEAGEKIYGVTTGIGEFARIGISPELGTELQKRIIFSHAAGVGDPQPIEVVKAAMLLRANTLARGHSAVRPLLVETMIAMANRGVTPVVYEKGSVGTSGDLSPMSQVAEVMLGVGEAFYEGERIPGAVAMEKAGIDILVPTFKEGLGIINGSQMATGQTALQIYDAERLLKNGMIGSAMTIDALCSVPKAFDARLHAVRPYNGQNAVAAAIRRLVEGSEVMADRSGKVQDGYSLRCTPQVIGPSIDAVAYARSQVEIEMNSASDNPLFFPDDRVHLAGGNFHGQPVAIASDLMGIAMSEVASLSERHTNRLLNPALSGLPDFLVEGKGLNSGLMVSQYTAAALVSENKVLSHPAVVDSISVSADQEDHVSMAPIAVRKLKDILFNVGNVLAIEMMCAAQAFDFRSPKRPGRGTAVAYDLIREKVTHLEDDRPLHPDIAKIYGLVAGSAILDAVEEEIGGLPLRFEN